jgi:hypothetical protein
VFFLGLRRRSSTQAKDRLPRTVLTTMSIRILVLAAQLVFGPAPATELR